MTTVEKEKPTESDNNILGVDPKAVMILKAMIMAEGNTEAGLGVKVSDGGCAGLKYKIGIKKESESTDLVREVEGIKLYIDQDTAPYVMGSVVTFEGMSIKLVNPNVKSSCSCGVSFGV